jgi:hypothetical protein
VNILYLIFNRPHLQGESFDAIRRARPAKLFIAADGPRVGRDDDQKRCEQARRIINEVNWKCEVKTLFRDVNLGCRKGVAEAITWFFRHVEDGVVLEDDCVASPFFFKFTEELLHHYREDDRVWCISGSNFQNGNWRGDGTYYFSRHSHCWGWASWRRCWTHYDDSMSLWKNVKSQDLLRTLYEDPVERAYWSALWETMTYPESNVDSWAFRWSFANLINNSLTALPNRNLVTNIGFAADGTHCRGTTIDPGIQHMEGKIIHPSLMLRDAVADEYTFLHVFGGLQMREHQRLSFRMKRRLRLELGKFRYLVLGNR